MKTGLVAPATRKAITAFRRLPVRQRDVFLGELVKNRSVREDLMDLAIAESRRKEPSRPLREFLSEVDARAR